MPSKASKARKSPPGAPEGAMETIPFDFDVEIVADHGDKSGDGRAKIVGYARCPEHRGDKRTGLERGSQHLIYRPHSVKTWGGHDIPCRASGVALCQCPDADKLQPCSCQSKWTKL